MSLSMYTVLTTSVLPMLDNLAKLLQKGAAHAAANGIAEPDLLGSRLAPDMHPLTRQVQLVSDMAKSAAARLTGIDPPSFPDEETSIAELVARLEKTRDFVRSVPEAGYAGSETRDVVVHTPLGDFPFKGQMYLLNFLLPNFYFHVTTAYDLLRHRGVPLGKMDFFGRGG